MKVKKIIVYLVEVIQYLIWFVCKEKKNRETKKKEKRQNQSHML